MSYSPKTNVLKSDPDTEPDDLPDYRVTWHLRVNKLIKFIK